ncbi:hypothetical protein F4801DRAFT_595692 [Xylaria longipes]|nr:hypothetical protein F4801DRAFT_595692 [Xylaria longipes]
MDVLPGSHPSPAGSTQISQTPFDRVNLDCDDEPFQEHCATLVTSENQLDSAYKKQEWRPQYLRQTVLLPSIFLCVSLIIAVELLFWYSRKNHGFPKSDNSLHYLWKYGPTAILTVIGSVWTRINYQAKMTAPWNRLAQGPAGAEKTLLLDYINPLPPVSVVNAIRNKDFGVAAAGTITLLWSLIIAISASFINLTPTDNHQTTVPVVLTTRFKHDSAALENASSISHYNMLGLQRVNLTFPDGVSDRYTYQRFAGRNIPSTAELHTTVDGFSAELICEESSYYIYLASLTDYGYLYLNFTMATTDCEITSGWIGPGYSESEIYYSRFGTGSCRNSSDPDDQRIVVTFGSLKVDRLDDETLPPHSPVYLNITKSVSLLCRPTYLISKVDAVKNESNILSIAPSPLPGPTTLGNIHAWDIARALIRSAYTAPAANFGEDAGLFGLADFFDASDIRIDVDPNMYLNLGQPRAPPSSTTLLNASFLQELTIRYYQTYALFIANGLLIEPASTESTGQAIMYEERLIVNGTSTHIMAAILTVAVLLFEIIMITTPKVSVLVCTPSSISDVAKLASHSDTVIKYLKSLGRSDSKSLAARLDDCSYMTSVQDGDALHQGYFKITTTNSPAQETDAALKDAPSINPASLQPWSRVGMSFLVLGIIVALEITLRASERNHGIGAVSTGASYLHYSWTLVPALVFTVAGLIYGSVDSSIRKLTPYVNLSRGSTFGRSLGLDLLNLSVPRLLVRELRSKSFAALSGTLAALIASLLTTLSSSLFVLSNVPLVATVQLHIESSLTNDSSSVLLYATNPLKPMLIPSLVLVSNLSYPMFTYENLVFPALNLDFNSTMGHDLVLNATLPAVRSKMDCRLYNGSSIAASVSNNKLNINVTIPATCFSPGVFQLFDIRSADLDLGDVSTGGIKAGAVDGQCTNDGWAADWVYFWADITPAPDPTIVSVSALVCNESVEAVDVFTSFIGADLTIDPGNPPVPNEAYNTTATNDHEEISYELLPTRSRYGMLDEFFSTLITSRYAIPSEYLRDTSRAESVQDAIIFQHSVIQAQIMNSGPRAPPESTNVFARGSAKNDAIAYHANMTKAIGQVRVVQDVASTRILQALLAAILGLSLVSWALMPQTRILPREPTSIASIMALLADGNVFRLLPTESQLMEEKELEYLFRGITFKMGWVEVIPLGEVVRTGERKVKFSVFGVI